MDSSPILNPPYAANAEARQKPLPSGEAHDLGRSRQVLWHQGTCSSGDDTRAEGCLIWKEETKVLDPQAEHGHAPNATPR